MTTRTTVVTADPDNEAIDDAEAERLWDEFYASVAPSPDAIRRADEIFESLTRTPTPPSGGAARTRRPTSRRRR